MELEHDNRLFVVALDRVLATFRRSDQKSAGVADERRKASDEESETE